MAKYGIVIDTKRCIGCSSCAVACKLENNVPDQVWYCRVNTIGGLMPHTPAGEYGNCTQSYMPVHCNHCDNPSCVEACPTGATWKDAETGIVMQDSEACIGCGACVEGCPFGARELVEGEPAYRVDFPVGDKNAPLHKANTVEKCTFCLHRVTEGREPACVEGCPARACFFGDLDDPAGKVNELLAAREYTTLLPEGGLGANVYYLA